MQRKKVWLSTHACVLSRFSRVCLFATLWAVSHQAPQITGFSREEYWREVPCPSPGDPPDPGIEPKAPAFQADSLPLSHQGSSFLVKVSNNSLVHTHPLIPSFPYFWWILDPRGGSLCPRSIILIYFDPVFCM